MSPNLTVWYLAKNIPITAHKILIDGVELPQVSDTKFLGVIADSKFTWKNHIDALSSKIPQQIRILKKVKYKLSSSTLTLLYNSLIQPHFYYCTIIWGSAYETNLTHLQSLQKQAIRVIT